MSPGVRLCVCMNVCVCVCLSTHCGKIVEEADAGWMRRFQRELEEGFHVQRGWDDRRTPEEGRDRAWSVYTSCGAGTTKDI